MSQKLKEYVLVRGYGNFNRRGISYVRTAERGHRKRGDSMNPLRKGSMHLFGICFALKYLYWNLFQAYVYTRFRYICKQ